MSTLSTAAEVAVRNAEIQRELTDEELLADFSSGFPRIPDMDRQIHTQWGPLSAHEAIEREKREFLARRRRAISEEKQRREEALKTAADREREQKEFEAAASRGEYRSALRRTLVSYEEGINAAREIEVALVNAKADLERLKGDNALDVVKLGKALGASRDLVDALETKLVRARETLASLEGALRQALGQAQREFMLLHGRERQELIAQARAQIEALFDRAALGRSPFRICQPESLAVCAQTVIALDKSAGFYVGRYNWPEVNSTESLLKAISEFEVRVSQTEGTLYLD
jgi:hypothetical protein